MRVKERYVAEDKPRKMSPKEFRELGYLQELNRRFLHPLGLALECVLNEDGSESFGEVWDCREDPEGIVFEEDLIDAEKAIRIRYEGLSRVAPRMIALGFFVQPES